MSLTSACGQDPGSVCRFVFEHTHSSTWAKIADTVVAHGSRIVVIVVVAIVLNRLVGVSIKRFVGRLAGSGGLLSGVGPELSVRAAGRARTVGAVLRSLASAVIYTLALVYVVGELGLQLGPLIAGAGIVGIALGFGAQSLVRDFINGIYILIEDQYGVGDTVDLAGAAGVVEQVTLRSTRVRDVNGTVWHVPNGEIRRVGNKSQQWARAVLDLLLSIDADLAEAQRVIEEVAAEVCASDAIAPDILEPPEFWGVENVGPDGVTVRVAVKTHPGAQFGVLRELRRSLVSAFEEHGIALTSNPGAAVMKPPADHSRTDPPVAPPTPGVAPKPHS